MKEKREGVQTVLTDKWAIKLSSTEVRDLAANLLIFHIQMNHSFQEGYRRIRMKLLANLVH